MNYAFKLACMLLWSLCIVFCLFIWAHFRFACYQFPAISETPSQRGSWRRLNKAWRCMLDNREPWQEKHLKMIVVCYITTTQNTRTNLHLDLTKVHQAAVDSNRRRTLAVAVKVFLPHEPQTGSHSLCHLFLLSFFLFLHRCCRFLSGPYIVTGDLSLSSTGRGWLIFSLVLHNFTR